MSGIVKKFGNSLSAQMSGESEEDYTQIREDALKELERIEDTVKRIKITDTASYKEAMALKGCISSLFCYTCNNEKPEYERVMEIEGRLGKKLLSFANKYRKIKDKTVKALAKYLITNWRYYYTTEDVDKIVGCLKDAGVLYKSEDSYFIIGLHYAVGDNVFGVSSNGSEYRLMQRSCAIQAFYLNSHWSRIFSALNIDVPELPDFYDKVGTGDGKYLAKVYLTRDEHGIVKREYCNGYSY